MRRRCSKLFAWIAVLLLALPALSERGSLPLRPGDTLPTLAGQTLSGKLLELPAAARGSVTVAIFSFSRAGGRDARDWAQRLGKDYPHLAIYNVIFLESVPRIFRNLAVSGMRSGMPPAVQERAILLYEQQGSWERMLQVSDANQAGVVVLGRNAQIRLISSGPFTEQAYARVKARIEP